MKKSILLSGLLLALTASLASAAGVDLRWNSCILETGSSSLKTFACTSNGGSSKLVGSFILPSDVPGVSGIEAVVDVAVAGSTLPAWWQFKNAGACRAAGLGVDGNPAGLLNCTDWSGAPSGPSGGLAAYQVGQNPPSGSGANTARMIIGLAVAPDALQDLFAGTEYFAFNALITNVKTVGTGACAGCSAGACIVFNSIKVATPPPPPGSPDQSVTISGPGNGTDGNFVTWQGGVGVSSARAIGCPLATPTHQRTWSTVKTLYR